MKDSGSSALSFERTDIMTMGYGISEKHCTPLTTLLGTAVFKYFFNQNFKLSDILPTMQISR